MSQIEIDFDREFEPKRRGRAKGRFDIDGNIVRWEAYMMCRMTFLSLWGESISPTGYQSHIADYDLDEALRNNEHHRDIYQVIHKYYDKKLYRKSKHQTNQKKGKVKPV